MYEENAEAIEFPDSAVAILVGLYLDLEMTENDVRERLKETSLAPNWLWVMAPRAG